MLQIRLIAEKLPATQGYRTMTRRPRLTTAMAQVRLAVRESLATAGLVADDLVLAAVSGGADSMALAAALAFEAQKVGIRAGAVIIEHGLQEATREVSAATARKLEALGLNPVVVREVTVGEVGGVEAAARQARYAGLAAQARAAGAKAVLLGHTLNDQAETVLLGLARGSGPRSVAGMEPETAAAGFAYLRPLLGIKRAQTEQFCLDAGIEFWVDPFNSDQKFARVRVREVALPVLEGALGPGVAEALARTAQLLREDLDLLDSQAQECFEKLVRRGPTSVVVSVSALAAQPLPISSRVIHSVVGIFGGAATKNHVDEVLQLVLNWHGQKELTLPSVRVVRHGDDLTFKSAKTLRPGAC